MAVGEVANLIDDHTVPSEAVSRVRLALAGYFDELVEASEAPHRKNGKLRMSVSIPVSAEADLFSSEWDDAHEQQVVDGGVDRLAIVRDVKTSAVASATISGNLPARLSREEARGLFRADSWHARLQFPPKHSHDESQRLVLDTWQTPWTHATLAAQALSARPTSKARHAAYEGYYRKMTERDETGIPLGAILIEHSVYGAPIRGFYLPEDQVTRLNDVMDNFAESVQTDVAWNKHIDANLARNRR